MSKNINIKFNEQLHGNIQYTQKQPNMPKFLDLTETEGHLQLPDTFPEL